MTITANAGYQQQKRPFTFSVVKTQPGPTHLQHLQRATL